MENGAASSVEDVNTTCHVSAVLTLLCRVLKHMKYHIYQPHLVPNYTLLLPIHTFFSSFFARANQELTFAAPCSSLIKKKLGTFCNINFQHFQQDFDDLIYKLLFFSVII